MPKLAHLLDDKPQAPVYQLDFGDRVTATVAQVIAQESVNRLIPTFESLLTQMVEGVQRIESGGDKAAAKVEAAAGDLDAAVRSEVKNVQADLKKAVKALTDASQRDRKALAGDVSTALGGIDIPDYSNELKQIVSGLSVILSSIKDIEPEKWPGYLVFDIERHNNGLLKRVVMKAK